MFLVLWVAGCGGDDGAVPKTSATTGSSGDTSAPPPVPTAETGTTPLPTGDTAPPTTAPTADTGCHCDDGLACSDDACDALGRCVALPLYDCVWPATAPGYATFLGALDPDGDLMVSQSDAYWDAAGRRLWVLRNSGPEGIWRLREDGAGGWVIDADGAGATAEWKDLGLGDIEGITQIEPVARPTVVTVIDEELGHAVSYDLAVAGVATEVARWDLSAWVTPVDRAGAEAITFVPDAALASWGFTDAYGVARTSALGMGGLVFVGWQLGGMVFVFDLDPAGGAVTWVGTYETARAETSGLAFDADTGRLYLWHGAMVNDVEVARLSSSIGVIARKLDTEYVFDYPETGNVEGVVVLGTSDCGPTGRPLFVIQDGGMERSIQLYPDWNVGCP